MGKAREGAIMTNNYHILLQSAPVFTCVGCTHAMYPHCQSSKPYNWPGSGRFWRIDKYDMCNGWFEETHRNHLWKWFPHLPSSVCLFHLQFFPSILRHLHFFLSEFVRPWTCSKVQIKTTDVFMQYAMKGERCGIMDKVNHNELCRVHIYPIYILWTINVFVQGTLHRCHHTCFGAVSSVDF